MHESEKWKGSRSVMSNLRDPIDCSLPGSSVHGIFQARVLEWGAIALADVKPRFFWNPWHYSFLCITQSLIRKISSHNSLYPIFMHGTFHNHFIPVTTYWIFMGCSGGASGKEPVCQCKRCKRQGFTSWVRNIPWRRSWQLTPVFLPEESYRQSSLAGYGL